MLVTKERPRAIRTLRGWAMSVLQEAGAIRECEDHGWAQDRADLHARKRATDIAEQDPPSSLSPRSKRSPRSGMCWIRLVTPAPSVRQSSSLVSDPIPARGVAHP